MGRPRNGWMLELPTTARGVGQTVWFRETIVQTRLRTDRAIQSGTSQANSDWSIVMPFVKDGDRGEDGTSAVVSGLTLSQYRSTSAEAGTLYLIRN